MKRSKSFLVTEFENLAEMVKSERDQVLEVAAVSGRVSEAESFLRDAMTAIPFVLFWAGQSENRLMRFTRSDLVDLVECAERVLGRLLERTSLELAVLRGEVKF